MASSTKEHTVPESGHETQARTAPREPTTKSARAFSRIHRASVPKSRPSGASALALY